MERCISRMPPGVEMLTCVWDRRGFSMGKNLDVPLLKNLASIMQNNCEWGGGAKHQNIVPRGGGEKGGWGGGVAVRRGVSVL